MSSDVIAAFRISTFLSLITNVKLELELFGTYPATLKSISITKSIEALLTFARARALTMHDLSFMLQSGSLLRMLTRVYSP